MACGAGEVRRVGAVSRTSRRGSSWRSCSGARAPSGRSASRRPPASGRGGGQIKLGTPPRARGSRGASPWLPRSRGSAAAWRGAAGVRHGLVRLASARVPARDIATSASRPIPSRGAVGTAFLGQRASGSRWPGSSVYQAGCRDAATFWHWQASLSYEAGARAPGRRSPARRALGAGTTDRGSGIRAPSRRSPRPRRGRQLQERQPPGRGRPQRRRPGSMATVSRSCSHPPGRRSDRISPSTRTTQRSAVAERAPVQPGRA